MQGGEARARRLAMLKGACSIRARRLAALLDAHAPATASSRSTSRHAEADPPEVERKPHALGGLQCASAGE